jgi:hypothetical protein
MGEMYHDLSTPKDNHISYGLSFPNQYAMENWQNEIDGQTPQNRHLGKTVRVMDTGREFMLIQIDPELVFQPLDGPAPLLDDLNLYINGTTGSDLTGDGSSGAPYKTFNRAFQVLENKRNSYRVKIRPAAGVYTDFPEVVNIDTDPGGQIVMDASGEAYPVVSGTHTIDSIAGVGVQNPFGNYEATDLTVSPDPGWTPDQFYGKFVHFKSGNYANRVLRVWKNSSDTIQVMMDLFTFQAGDTFDIVDAPVKIEVDHPIRFVGRRVADQTVDFFNPQLVIAGVEFEVDVGSTDSPPMSLHDISAVMTYSKLVDMWNTDQYSIPLLLNGSKINLDFLASGVLDNTELEQFINYSFIIQALAGTSPAEKGLDVVMYNSEYASGLGGVACRRYVFLGGVSGYLSFCDVGGFVTFFDDSGVAPISSAAWLNVVYIDQVDYDDIAIIATVANLDIIEAYIEKSGLPIYLAHNSYLQADWLHGNTINSQYAARIGPASSLFIPTAAYMTLLGTTGAIQWDFDGATVAAWPTAGNFVQKVDSFVSTKT